MAIARQNLNSNQDYNNCVANCKQLFPNSEAALVACINGCAKVNSPGGLVAIEATASQFQAEVDRIGKREYFTKVRSAARGTLAQLPDIRETERLDPLFRRYVERLTVLMDEGMKLSEADEGNLARFAQEVAWAKLVADIAVAAIARRNDGGGGTGPTCVTKCANEYDQCVSENGCDTSGWICVCCTPCSLQYMGCVARCALPVGGFGGVVIA